MSVAGSALFYLFAIVAILSALGTVVVHSPIRAAMSLLTHILSLTGLFLLLGPAVPGPVKRRLGLLLAVQIAVAVSTAAARSFTPLAFGILVPVFGLGLNGLWAARHGTVPPRRTTPTRQDHHDEGGMEQNADHG